MVAMTSDEQLMEALGRGDMEALGELVRRHQKFVWSIAYRFFGDAAEAEDIAQETFLRLLRAAPRYRPDAPIQAYLHRIAFRLCLDAQRKGKRLRLDGALQEGTPSRDPSPSQSASSKQEIGRLRKALLDLPPRQRLAVIGRYFEDMSYAEIAESLDVTPKAVERLLGRARNALARGLGTPLQ